MTVQEIIVEQLGVRASAVVPTASLIDDLGADDLDMVELVVLLEDEFSITIDDEDADKFKYVQDVVQYVVEHTKGKL